MVMLDESNPSVLSYARVDNKGHAVLVSLNMTAEARPVSLDLKAAGVTGRKIKTLLSSDSSLTNTSSTEGLTIPPFATWVAEVE